jgi:hypothetical protein
MALFNWVVVVLIGVIKVYVWLMMVILSYGLMSIVVWVLLILCVRVVIGIVTVLVRVWVFVFMIVGRMVCLIALV